MLVWVHIYYRALMHCLHTLSSALLSKNLINIKKFVEKLIVEPNTAWSGLRTLTIGLLIISLLCLDHITFTGSLLRSIHANVTNSTSCFFDQSSSGQFFFNEKPDPRLSSANISDRVHFELNRD